MSNKNINDNSKKDKGLIGNEKIEEAIEFATKVSNITVTRKGAIDSIPTYNEVINKNW